MNTPDPETVEVIAPYDLPPGYQFDVELQGRNLLVRVPEGGAKSGQCFAATVVSAREAAANPHGIPSGHWRDGLCDCGKHGLCHPSLWMSLCCPICALGQIMERMKLDKCGSKDATDGNGQGQGTYKFIFWMTILAFLLGPMTLNVSVWALFFYFLTILVNTRANLRNTYEIKGNELKDCCLSFWCTCCVVGQMGRYTADYEMYDASCCGDTGLAPGAPAVV